MRGLGFVGRVMVVLCMMTLSCHHAKALPPDSLSLAMMEETWREFLEIHPFGFQTVALKHYGDTCVFVMSEPSEMVSREELGRLFSDFEGHLIACRHPFGADGALYDAAGCVRLDSIQFPAFEKRLFTLLYGTDYKPYYTDLDDPSPHIYYSEQKLNYNVFFLNGISRELFCFPDCKYKALEFIDSLNTGNSNDLFYSNKRGFVAWRISPNAASLTDTLFLRNARKFCLDTDVIVQLHPCRDGIVIVGRERELPVTILPPLRAETICQILSIDKPIGVTIDSYRGECYEDSTLFVTPIKGSSVLQNSELGNLMILCDMMLKSWSENGTAWDCFTEEYPMPDRYPFANGVAKVIGDSIKYYWDFGPFPGNNTGSPMLYYSSTPKDSITETAKTIADEYFAGLANTDLARLAAYHQIFVASMRMHHAIKNNDTLQVSADSFLEDLQREVWVETPTITVSENKWGYGGYLFQRPLVRSLPQVVQSLSRRNIPNISNIQRMISMRTTIHPVLKQSMLNLDAALRIGNRSQINAAQKVYDNAYKRYVPIRFQHIAPPSPPNFMDGLNARNTLISPQTENLGRGLVHEVHVVKIPVDTQSQAINGRTKAIERLNDKLLRLKAKHKINFEIKNEITIIAHIIITDSYGEYFADLAA